MVDVLKSSRTSTNWTKNKAIYNHLLGDTPSERKLGRRVDRKVVIFYIITGESVTGQIGTNRRGGYHEYYRRKKIMLLDTDEATFFGESLKSDGGHAIVLDKLSTIELMGLSFLFL